MGEITYEAGVEDGINYAIKTIKNINRIQSDDKFNFSTPRRIERKIIEIR